MNENADFKKTRKDMGPVRVVPRAGIEPARGCPHWILNPARLPISPPRQPGGFRGIVLVVFFYKKFSGTVRLSHRGFPGSTIGAKELDFCVRDGNRYNPLTISTGKQLVTHPESGEGFIKEQLVFLKVKSHGQLVPVSFRHYCPSTSGLSNRSSF